jgi:uncharacterized protein YciI
MRTDWPRTASISALERLLRQGFWSGALLATPAHCTPQSGNILSPVPRDPNIPDAFDVYTLILLRRPADAPEMSDTELDTLQAQHLAYRAQLRREGVIVVNGPLGEQSDVAMRGLSIFACDIDEAKRLSDGDPSVRAGRLAYDVMEWWVAADSLAFPDAKRPVGERRVMPDD